MDLDEAGITAAIYAHYAERHNTAFKQMEAAIAAYLSRCPSPERDTEKLVEAARWLLDVWDRGSSPHGALNALRAALAEFTAPKAGER